MKTFITILIIALIGIWGYVLFYAPDAEPVTDTETVDDMSTDTMTTPEEEVVVEDETETVIGESVDGRAITAYHYGAKNEEGTTNLLFIGGIHGGYSWNTSLVAYELMDYLEENPDALPERLRVTVIPTLNPDGLATLMGDAGRFTKADVPQGDTTAARFNANDVDLNRNFDCSWEATGTWQNRDVSGGEAPFSEPEAAAIREYINTQKPDAAVVWYSAAGGVFASSCHNGVSEETETLTELYAQAAGYTAYDSFDFYKVTGDMVNWFASKDIPAISVLLSTHADVEWDKNKAGIDALFAHYE